MPPMSERISVVIPHYGQPGRTLSLIDQLRPQLADRHEIIVADDCSPVPFPDADADAVKVIRQEANGGFGSAVNSGAAAASGDLLLVLNSDLEVGPTFLADLVAAALPWQPCVAGPRIIENGGVDDSARHFPTVSQQVVEWLVPLARWRSSRPLHEAVGHDMRAVTATEAIVTDWLVGATLLIPLQTFRSIGGFDERFYMNSEEVDLQRRLGAVGIPSVYLPTVTVLHKGGGASDPAKRRRWLVESRWTYARKWGGVAPLKAGLTAATGVNLLWNSGRRLAGRGTAPLRAAREEFDMIWERQPR
jgi:N-acetylglucosaminyl-diphospho-decaprenol L-rhamnosyltransferase